MRDGDTVDDLFPGTGIVSECLIDYLSKDSVSQKPLFIFDDRSLVSSEQAVVRGLPEVLA